MSPDQDVPHGWTKTNLASVALWGSGGTPARSIKAFYGGSITWLKTGELGAKYVYQSEESITEAALEASSAKLFPAGSVALAMYGATIGKVSILGVAAATNQACAVGQPHGVVTSAEFLYYYLLAQKDAFVAAGQGGAQPNISQGVVKAWPITLPPRAEQQRIADKLDTLLARVDAVNDRLARVAPLLKRFRQAVLAAATSGRLTADWRAGRTMQPVELVRKKGALVVDPDGGNEEWLLQLPSSWLAHRAADVVDEGSEIVYGIVQPGPRLDIGVPYVRGMDIVDGRIQVGQLLRTSQSIAAKYERASLRGGDVLLGIIRATKVAIVPDELSGANITQGTARFRPSKVVSSKYLAFVLECPQTQAWLHAHYRGIDMPGLNLADVRRTPIPLPPASEQAEIVRRVDILLAFAGRLEAKLQAAQTASARLTPALLAKAFRGELVPQDPADEPAIELLKRLAAERAEATKPKRSRGAVRAAAR